MKYRYTEASSIEVSVSFTLQQLTELRALAQALLADTPESQAALTLTGWSRWDARRLRDDAQSALVSASEIMKQEARAIDERAKQD
jgi:hypothetical protein